MENRMRNIAARNAGFGCSYFRGISDQVALTFNFTPTSS